ncbi:MAG: hypothetical protein HY717_15980 [Planctomycetes bacterium]|nr:hypothetical protein [Planctomycetota bacterium]
MTTPNAGHLLGESRAGIKKGAFLLALQRGVLLLIILAGALFFIPATLILLNHLNDALSQIDSHHKEAKVWDKERSDLEARAAGAEKLTEDLRQKEKDLQTQVQAQTDKNKALADEQAKLSGQLAALNEAVKKLTAERDALAGEKTAAAKEIETLKSASAKEIEALKADLAAKTVDLGKFQGAVDSLKALFAELKTQLGGSESYLKTSVEELKTLKKNNDLLAAETSRLGAELRDTAQQLAKAELLCDKAQLEKAQLLFEKQKLSHELSLARKEGAPPPASAPPSNEAAPASVENPPPKPPEEPEPAYPEAPIETKVGAVDDKEGIAVLGAGQDKGVLKNMQFTVLRNGERVAVLKAVKIYTNHTGCTILSREAGKEIQIGDSATTKK